METKKKKTVKQVIDSLLIRFYDITEKKQYKIFGKDLKTYLYDELELNKPQTEEK